MLTEYHLERHEDAVVEAVLGARRPKRFLLELTILLLRGGAHLAEASFAGRIVRQWYFVDFPAVEDPSVGFPSSRPIVAVFGDSGLGSNWSICGWVPDFMGPPEQGSGLMELPCWILHPWGFLGWLLYIRDEC